MGANLIGYLWDKLTFIPWYIMVGHAEKLAISRRQKSIRDKNGENIWYSADSNGEVIDTYYYGLRTMPAMVHNYSFSLIIL